MLKEQIIPKNCDEWCIPPTELNDLAKLRKKVDYEHFKDISLEEVSDAIENMEKIFNLLEFQ